MPFDKMTNFTFSHAAQDDTPDLTPAQVKEAFDSRGDEIKTFLDALIDALNNANAASNIGAKEVSGLTGATPQALIESLKEYLDTNFYTDDETDAGFATKAELAAAILGAIVDGSLTNAKLATDIKVGSLATALATDKSSVIAVANDIAGAGRTTETVKGNADDIANHLADTAQYSTYKLNMDANGIYTEVQHKRADGTLILKSVLSGGTSPKYTTRTETKYAANGTTVEWTKAYTLTYDANDNVASEVLSA